MLPKIPFARAAHVALGLWLFLSCFAWPHEANPTIIVALFGTALITAFELMSLMEPACRFGTMLMGSVIVAEGLFCHHWLAATKWHDAAIGALVMLLSLVPNEKLPDPVQAQPATVPVVEKH